MMRSLAIACALTTWATVALAAPTIVPYAGYLTDADGAPYEGTVDVRTAIYGCATEAEECPAAWQGAELTGIAVTGGVLRFELGAAEDTMLVDALTGEGPLWLDIELKTEGAETWTALEPRHGLQAVPFAISAVNADQLGGMDAKDYATAAELTAFTTLEDIASAGYLTDTQLADAGYLMTEALTPYVTTEALEAMGYLTQSDIDAGTYMTAEQVSTLLAGDPDAQVEGYTKPSEVETAITEAIADMVTTTVLSATLQTYVTSEALTGTLQDYITTTALTESLQPYLLAADTYTDAHAIAAVETVGYLLAADKYTDNEAVAAVEAAGYALSDDLPTQYTDELAVTAVEAAGYAKEGALMRMLSGLVFGAAAKASLDASSSASATVDAGNALNNIIVDLNISDTLDYQPPSQPESNPSKEHHTYVICNANLRQNNEVITLSQPSSLVASEHLFDNDAVTIDRTVLLTMTLFASVPSEWNDSPFDVEIACTPVCTSIGSSATCEREVQVSFVTRTF